MAVSSGSDSSVKGSECRSANLAWEATLSLLTPMTATPRRLNSSNCAAKAQAWRVQPGVLSLG